MRLTAPQRTFFTLLSQAVFANPFSEARERIDARVAGVPAGTAWDLVLARMLGIVAERLEELPERDLRRWDEGDRALLELALIFEVYHRFGPHFEGLIQEELAGKRGRGQRVPFAKDVLRALERHGVPHESACRYVALFWQLRRAYYFIARSLPGVTPSMRRLRESLWNSVLSSDIRLYAQSLWRTMEDFSTFLVGETGSGKGAAAAAIGRSGFIPYDAKTESFQGSFTECFLAINLSQFSPGVLESELFGHKKGAFTGAIDAHPGVFQRCSAYGSIFLDEIGDVGLDVQVKLLGVLQERVFHPVGSHEAQRFRGRVIAATNRPVAELRAAGKFRDDFYYRLSSCVVHVPTLRERLREDPAELDVLLGSILPKIVGPEVSDVPALVARVRAAIDTSLGRAYPWPGNVRELEQCIRRVLLTDACAPDTRHDPTQSAAALLDATGGGAWSAEELLGRYCRALYDRHGTYEEVARRAGLDRRTAKRYVGLEGRART
jgi:transcriptional regulator with AAA-type ATPase domain